MIKNSDNINITELYETLQEFIRLNREIDKLKSDLLDTDLKLMQAELALKLARELKPKLHEIHLPSSVQEGGE